MLFKKKKVDDQLKSDVKTGREKLKKSGESITNALADLEKALKERLDEKDARSKHSA